MRALILFCVVFQAVLFLAFGRDKPQDKFQSARVFRKKVKTTETCQYLLYLPRDYSAKPKERWPLMLFLHGAGERGTNVWRSDLHGPAKYIAAHPDFPFIVLTPLCPSNEVWSKEVLTNLLDETIQKYHTDTNRVYLTGLSLGGFGTWDLALACPEKFAAVIPIAGGGNDLPIILARLGYCTPQYVAALKSLPFWAFHGGKDGAVPHEESERLIASLKALGVAEAKVTIYPDATHNSWERTYNNPEVYDWLLQHHR
jgi:predicted peptidase